MSKAKAAFSQNQFILFWVGLLTGALIVGLVFGYQAIETANMQDAIMKYFESFNGLEGSSFSGPDDTNFGGPDGNN